MTTITDFTCFFNDKELLSDAQGNNAAFACPECGHPILLVAGPVNTRGIKASSKPSACQNCNKEYWAEIDEVAEKIYITYAN